MFIDLSFFEVEEGHQRSFERDFGTIVLRARDTTGCITSELVRLDEDFHYVWVERWDRREEHNAFNEILFGELLPSLPDIGRYASRLVERDAEGYVVI
ncbi:MAG TPA: antibiotic biosynthesis monooxygenase [Nitrolancea sp.]